MNEPMVSHDARDRRRFLEEAFLTLMALSCRARSSTAAAEDMKPTQRTASSKRMPVVFVGHGSPMNAITDNRWSRAFKSLGEGLPTPRAILAVSAHWYVPGTFLTEPEHPETIHDFGGFPPELHAMQYPASGDAALARTIAARLGAFQAATRTDWGLDHGTWSVLVHMRPAADVPVLQLSIDGRLPAAGHIAIGKALQPLRDEGVLILGSGNVVHNLRDAFGNMRLGKSQTPSWAAEFDERISIALRARDEKRLATALDDELGRKAHPSPDHYLPLLYTLGASTELDDLSFPISGFDAGSISMRAAVFG